MQLNKIHCVAANNAPIRTLSTDSSIIQLCAKTYFESYRRFWRPNK